MCMSYMSVVVVSAVNVFMERPTLSFSIHSEQKELSCNP